MKTEKRTSRIIKIIGDILLAMFALLTVDVVIVMIHKINTVVLKADYREIFVYELILCSILILFSADVRFNLFGRPKNRIVKGISHFLRVIVAALAIVIMFFAGKVISGSMINTSGQADKAIVLGLALENGKPTDDLIARLNTAQAYLKEYRRSRLILTGGNADETGRTEAAVMQDLLRQRGVPEERMTLEDKAESTKENFQNTAKMIDPKDPVVLISSNYHMDRAVQLAKSAGFSHILRLPAPSSYLSFGANVMSEVVLELNELTLRR